MKLVKNWGEYRENWADLGRGLKKCGNGHDIDPLLNVMVVVALIVWSTPCCLIGIAPSEEENL